MKKLSALVAVLLLVCGCTPAPVPALSIATPGPEQETVLRGPYRAADEPAEVFELDAEHGYWAYRNDSLSVTADCRDYVLDDGAPVNWCAVEVYWRGADTFDKSVLPQRSFAETTACENGFVLFVPGAAGKTLLSDGAVCKDVNDERGQLSAAGIVEDGHWIVIAAGQTSAGDSVGLSERELAGLLLDEGCETAFLLASGAEAAVVFLGTQLNDPMDGERSITSCGCAWGKTERMMEG